MNKLYIDGEWREAVEGGEREVINPGTGEVITHVAEATKEDVQLAVSAARIAFDEGPWRDMKAAERASYLFTLADKLESIKDEMAELEMRDNGKPLRETEYDVDDAADCLRFYAGLATKPHGQTYEVSDETQAMTVREPIGVCGLIVPWNYPLLMAIWKIAPALAAGNTVIFKPSELTPLSVCRFFELIDSINLPKGVINLVMGAGAEVGAAMSAHMDVDKIAFTGGTETGRKIMTAATGNIKKVSLELGGKSPNIIFEDADIDTAVDWALFGIFANQGQVCSAGSRLLLQESIYEEFTEKLVSRAKNIKIGPGHIEGVEMGAMVSEAHMLKVLNYIETGKKEGATLLCGGERLTEGDLTKGYFISPTIFTDTTEEMTIIKEEIFGPVLAIQTFTTEEEAIRMANNSIYGLAGGVFTTDGARGLRVVKKLRAGITWINAYHPTYNEAPWGGYKQSGFGRDLGTYGFEEYTEVKQININLQPGPVEWFEN